MFGKFRSPHIGEQLPVGHHPARAAHQPGQQVEFGGCEVQGFATARHNARCQVNVNIFQRVRGHRSGQAGAAVAQRDPYACQQFAHAERLGQVVICARVQQGNLLGFLMPG